MGSAQSKHFAFVMMTITSLGAMYHVPPDRFYAKAAFRIYFLTGVLNVTAHYLGTLDVWLKPLEIAFVWSYSLGLPLIAADACNASGQFPELASLHILVPTATLIAYHLDPLKIDNYILGVSHGYSLLTMAAGGILFERFTPYAVALVYYFTLFRIDPKTSTTSFLETWSMMIALANIFYIAGHQNS